MGGLRGPVGRVLAVACLVAGLFPWWSSGEGRTDVRLGLPFSPVFRYERRGVEASDVRTMFGEGARFEATSISGYRSEWAIRVFSWSMALAASGAILLPVSLRRGPGRGPPGRQASEGAAP